MSTARAFRREAFFLGAAGRRLFATATYPQRVIGGLLYVHPFAEEMNKARRMAALAAESFARHGWLVLQPDLTGCGDSSGDFGDARWQIWLDDIEHAFAWLNQRAPRCGLWTLRAGSLLGAGWVERSAIKPFFLFWQPVRDGRQHLTQVLRLKAANELLTANANRNVVTGLREAIARGETVEVAGYRLDPALAQGLDDARLVLADDYPAPVAVLEVTNTEPLATSPGTTTLVAKWSAAGIRATANAVSGPSFWQTVEIETAEALLPASLAALSSALQ